MKVNYNKVGVRGGFCASVLCCYKHTFSFYNYMLVIDESPLGGYTNTLGYKRTKIRRELLSRIQLILFFSTDNKKITVYNTVEYKFKHQTSLDSSVKHKTLNKQKPTIPLNNYKTMQQSFVGRGLCKSQFLTTDTVAAQLLL